MSCGSRRINQTVFAATRARPADAKKARPVADDIAEIYRVVAAIPRGKVATYGEIAELAGKPMGHRWVARAMRCCPAHLPWQRVVGRHDARRAHISIGDAEHAALQRKLLVKEGVVFDDAGLIVMRKSGWIH